jgi:hypothetical protein
MPDREAAFFRRAVEFRETYVNARIYTVSVRCDGGERTYLVLAACETEELVDESVSVHTDRVEVIDVVRAHDYWTVARTSWTRSDWHRVHAAVRREVAAGRGEVPVAPEPVEADE